MNSNISLRVGVCVVVAALGCSKSGGNDAQGSGAQAGAATGGSGTTGGSGGKAGAGATGGAGAAGKSSGPPITSAPAAWAPPADCGGIGNLCPNLSGCGARSTCQLEGNVCIPSFTGSSLPSRTADTPYCAAYTCMTFEEASCFCTGPAGMTVSACSSPEALAGLCVAQGQSCAATKCCDGLSCTDNGSGSSLCQKQCSTSSDCSTGCCTDVYDTGVMICADASACTNPCKKRGEACDAGSATTANNCCRGSCVQSDNPDYAGCRPYCTTNADCKDTGCCVPFSNGGGFCADARYCSCGDVNAACNANDPACCDGNACAGVDSAGTSFKCYKDCKAASDCPNGDCAPLSDNSTSICLTTANDCTALGGKCGGDLASCCTGSKCVRFGSDTDYYTCAKSCSTNTDCPSGVCVPNADGTAVCLPQ